ncbi:helix-turn-helix domain-containing protein [Arthrobacter sp.]|uniref:helix-turn-helix transcriptional regulator n=1 Tax=Arthrobacter sp. TaxID=1667 RepID=UPI002812672C|nr:helix-turn-helix domain-containing protein [Arthrobacter sp.]
MTFTSEGRGDRLMSTEELAEYLSVPIATVYAWRSRRKAPPGIRVGRFVRFRQSEVDAWLASRPREVA